MASGRDDDHHAKPAGRPSGDGDGDGDGLPAPPAWRLAELHRLREELSGAIDALTAGSGVAADALPFASAIVETLHEPLLILKPDLIVQSANPAFYQHFNVHPRDTVGRMIYDLGNGQWDIPELRRALEE